GLDPPSPEILQLGKLLVLDELRDLRRELPRRLRHEGGILTEESDARATRSMTAKAEPSNYLVTGANRGIGLAFARALSRRGDRVIATARDSAKARELGGLEVQVEALDVADERSIASLARRLAGEPIDVLINNAGVGEAGPGLRGPSVQDLESTLRVNAIGPVILTRELLPNLRAGRRRTVVNLSSGLGSVSGNTDGGWSAYRASKAALNQLTRTMAAELARERFIC